ncbi:hypothetical protein DBR17_17760 [Sphingomonas sp. HMWF008]|nr:hypothetical protein DBR17_17760 [Sphingomonas sp. HMWF008]
MARPTAGAPAMIAQIELAMLAQLKAVADAGGTGFAWRTLETYPEDWDAFLMSQSEIRTPAAWVVFAGWSRAERWDDGSVVVDGSFGLMIADENLRSAEQYQRHGGADPAKEPGSYRLALAAVASLAGQSLGLDLVAPLELGQLRAVRPTDAIRKRKLSMYAAEFTCRFRIALFTGDVFDELRALHSNWVLPIVPDPFALPDDFNADATDHVELETDSDV